MAISDDDVKRFAVLFSGYDRAYGNFEAQPAVAGEKAKGRAWTTTGSLPESRWRSHLEGVGPGLGIIMLKDNDTCRFGALDVDEYNVDHAYLYRKLQYYKVPLVLCRTKSGGAHLYLFLKEDCPAVLLRERLDEWCQVLGLSAKTERFPKQISRFSPTDIGNWINIPYQNAERTMRFGIVAEKALTLKEFLDYVEANLVSLETLRKTFEFPKQAFENPNAVDARYMGSEWVLDGPPCLATLFKMGGFKEGERNKGMAAVAVYIRKRFGQINEKGVVTNEEELVQHIAAYNTKFSNLPSKDTVDILHNMCRKSYSYQCNEEPIKSVCNRRVCLSQQFGVGESGSQSIREAVLDVVRYDYGSDSPLWSFEINGKRIMLDNDSFYSRDAVNRACMAQANHVPMLMNASRFLKMVQEAVAKSSSVPMPESATPIGQLGNKIEMFLEQSVPALTKDEIASGKILHGDDGRVYFRGSDLFDYLKSRNVRYKSEQMVWQLLRKNGATVEKLWISGRAVSIWSMPDTMPKAESKEKIPEPIVPAPMGEF